MDNNLDKNESNMQKEGFINNKDEINGSNNNNVNNDGNNNVNNNINTDINTDENTDANDESSDNKINENYFNEDRLSSEDINVNEDESKVQNTKSFNSAPETKKNSIKKEIFEWVQAITIAVLIALVLRTYVFALIKVNGQSMYPTLHHDDRLIVVKLMYKPTQGDIIILNPPEKSRGPFVKRIIALPGQTVDIDPKTHEVKVDGKALNEDYINEKTIRLGDTKFPIKVPENHVFVMGDNRNNSLDSRFSSLGPVPYKSIVGKVTFRLWPFEDIGYMYK